MYNHAAYLSHSRAFVNRDRFFHGRADFGHAGLAAPHGFAATHGVHTGAFSGFGHGGAARAYSFRGRSSVGGGFHGGGMHAGGFHGGGGHR
jgi:hypothetical protein